MTLKDYPEAAKCFLGALVINPEAEHIWDNLRTVFLLMGRKDLANKSELRDVNLFSDEFNFM